MLPNNMQLREAPLALAALPLSPLFATFLQLTPALTQGCLHFYINMLQERVFPN